MLDNMFQAIPSKINKSLGLDVGNNKFKNHLNVQFQYKKVLIFIYFFVLYMLNLND